MPTFKSLNKLAGQKQNLRQPSRLVELLRCSLIVDNIRTAGVRKTKNDTIPTLVLLDRVTFNSVNLQWNNPTKQRVEC